MQRGIPFDVKLPSVRLLEVLTLSESEMNLELEKGYTYYIQDKTKLAGDALFLYSRFFNYDSTL